MSDTQLVFLRVPANDPDGSARFYSEFFGIDLASHHGNGNQSYFAPIGHGVDLAITPRSDDDAASETFFFHVDDLDAKLRAIEAAGGKQTSPVIDLSSQDEGHPDEHAGRAAVVSDPDGNQLGLVELDPRLHDHFKVGDRRQSVADERRTAHEQAA